MTSRQVRGRLSDIRVWMGIAYFLLAFVIVAALVDYGHAQKAIDRARSVEVQRTVEQTAARQARIAQCVASIPLYERINGFVTGVREFHIDVARNAKAILDETPRGSPEYAVRLRNYQRVAATIPLVSGVTFPVPTVETCRKLR